MVDTLSEEQTNEFKEIFDRYCNDDSVIVSNDLRRVMRSLGKNPTEAEIQNMICEVDVDGNGVIGFIEFCSLMTQLIKDSGVQDELLEIFKVFDRDGNGQVSKAELRYAISNNIDEKLNDKKLLNILKTADIDDLVERADTN